MIEEKMQEQQPETGRLVALAERLADEGQMNLNKLLEAIVYARSRRAGWTHHPPVRGQTMVQELAACIEELRHDGVAPQLLDALQTGLNALQAGRGGDMLAEEAPDVYVCRTCGHTALRQPPQRCPNCGAWPGRFRKFVAIYNGDNTEPLNPIAVLNLLEENAHDLQRLVGALDEQVLVQEPGGGAWSIREHIVHWAITQNLLETRVQLMLQEDNPDLSGVSAYDLDKEQARIPQMTTRQLLDDFTSRRQQLVARLRSLPLRDLYRSGRHSEFGENSILRQAAYFANHEQTHLPEIEALCARFAGK